MLRETIGRIDFSRKTGEEILTFRGFMRRFTPTSCGSMEIGYGRAHFHGWHPSRHVSAQEQDLPHAPPPPPWASATWDLSIIALPPRPTVTLKTQDEGRGAGAGPARRWSGDEEEPTRRAAPWAARGIRPPPLPGCRERPILRHPLLLPAGQQDNKAGKQR